MCNQIFASYSQIPESVIDGNACIRKVPCASCKGVGHSMFYLNDIGFVGDCPHCAGTGNVWSVSSVETGLDK